MFVLLLCAQNYKINNFLLLFLMFFIHFYHHFIIVIFQ